MPQSLYASDVKRLRGSIAFSQAELAEAVGCSPSTIGRMERTGRGHPSIVERIRSFVDQEREREKAWLAEARSADSHA